MWSNTPSPYKAETFCKPEVFAGFGVSVCGDYLNQGKPPCTSSAEVLLEELLASRFRTALRSRTGLLECDDRAAWLRRNTFGGYLRRGGPFVNIEHLLKRGVGNILDLGFYTVMFEDPGVAYTRTSRFEFLARNGGQEFPWKTRGPTFRAETRRQETSDAYDGQGDGIKCSSPR